MPRACWSSWPPPAPAPRPSATTGCSPGPVPRSRTTTVFCRRGRAPMSRCCSSVPAAPRPTWRWRWPAHWVRSASATARTRTSRRCRRTWRRSSCRRGRRRSGAATGQSSAPGSWPRLRAPTRLCSSSRRRRPWPPPTACLRSVPLRRCSVRAWSSGTTIRPRPWRSLLRPSRSPTRPVRRCGLPPRPTCAAAWRCARSTFTPRSATPGARSATCRPAASGPAFRSPTAPTRPTPCSGQGRSTRRWPVWVH